MKVVNPPRLVSKIKKNLFLFSAQMRLTNRCNENCIHCLVNKNKNGELNTDRIKDILCQLRKLGCMEITFTGGEVFLRGDFFEIADFTKRKGMGIYIQSNGTLVNEKNLKFLKEIRPLDIQISLYAIDAKIHDFTTRFKGAFERTMRAIRLLKENKIPFSIAAIGMRHNFWQLPLLRDTAKIKKWKINFDFIIRPYESGSLKAPLRHRITDAQIRKAYALDLLPFINKNKKLKLYDKETLCINNIGRTHIFISSEGKVFPDVTIRIKIGNLKKDSLYFIWNNSKKINWLRDLTLSDFECSKCKYLLRCCCEPGLALAEHNDLFKRPKELCRFIKHIAQSEKIDELSFNP